MNCPFCTDGDWQKGFCPCECHVFEAAESLNEIDRILAEDESK